MGRGSALPFAELHKSHVEKLSVRLCRSVRGGCFVFAWRQDVQPNINVCAGEGAMQSRRPTCQVNRLGLEGVSQLILPTSEASASRRLPCAWKGSRKEVSAAVRGCRQGGKAPGRGIFSPAVNS